MKIIYFDNPIPLDIGTRLLSKVEANSNTLNVENASIFSINDIILIEEVGCEIFEIKEIKAINENTITLNSPVAYDHNFLTKVTKLNYDKLKITRGASLNETFTDIYEDYINYADEHNRLVYYDRDLIANDEMYYKVYYLNSVTGAEVLGATLHKEDNFSYISVDKFRQQTGFTEDEASDGVIIDGLINALEWIRDNAYFVQTLKGAEPDTTFTLDLDGMEMADWNADRKIDKYDLVAYEHDNESEINTYITHKIVKVIPDGHKIFFLDKVPTPGKTLFLTIPVTFKKYNEIQESLAEISKLLATNYILQNTSINKFRQGITSWNAGGTSVSRDPSALSQSIENNLNSAKQILDRIVKLYAKPSKLRTTYSSLDRRVYNAREIHTTGGNTYKW